MRAFARYCKAKYKEHQKTEIYNIYVTDCLKQIAENTAKISGGAYIRTRYYDLVNPPKEDPRTAEEVKNYMIDRINRG